MSGPSSWDPRAGRLCGLRLDKPLPNGHMHPQQGQPGNFIKTKMAMNDIAYDILLDTGIRIQPLPVWEDEWAHPERYSNPHLLHNIAVEGITL